MTDSEGIPANVCGLPTIQIRLHETCGVASAPAYSHVNLDRYFSGFH